MSFRRMGNANVNRHGKRRHVLVDSFEELCPSLTYRFVPDIWFESPGSWAELGQMGLHIWFSEPWEYVTVMDTKP